MKKLLLLLLLTSGLASAQTTHMINWFMGVSSGQASRTIDVGDTVMWMWTEAGMPHTVTSQPGAHETFDSGMLTGVGQSFSHTFTTAGSSNYRCTFHPSMTGTITVNALATPTFDSQKLIAWPNPVSDQLTLDGAQGTTRIQIFDSTGRRVMDSAAETPTIKIYMDNFPSGLYAVQVNSDAGTQRFKIVKN